MPSTLSLTGPQVLLKWDPVGAGSSFGGYEIFRKPALPFTQFKLIAGLYVPDGYTPANVDAQHTSFIDYEAGTNAASGPFSIGWDYALRWYNATKRQYSDLMAIGAQDLQNPVPTMEDIHWIGCNTAPYLCCPVDLEEFSGPREKASQLDPNLIGRDYFFSRTRPEKPGRTRHLKWSYYGVGLISEHSADWPTALHDTGRQVTLVSPRGDHITGTIEELSNVEQAVSTIETSVTGTIVETDDKPALAQHNLPAGLVLNGTSQRITIPDATDLRPGTGPFTVVLAMALSPWASNKEYFAKYTGVVGWEFWATGVANRMEFWAGGAANQAGENNAVWYDGAVHIAVGTSAGNGAGNSRKLYRDGILVDTQTGAYTSITGTEVVSAGASSAGTAWAALNPVQSLAIYDRELTQAEVTAATRYLKGIAGYRMPGGLRSFIDLRDDRTWNGLTTSLVDGSGRKFRASVVGGPITKGIPWPIKELDVVRA